MKADPKGAEAAAPNAKKKMLIMIILGLLVAGLGGGLAWFFTRPGDGAAAAKVEAKPAEKPEFLVIEPFTVNLQPENGEQYLQVQFTLQVGSLEQAELIKTNMARVRSRVLMILSAKKASELITVEGKKQLSAEIIAAVKEPFFEKAPPQDVSDVLFTSFIIQ